MNAQDISNKKFEKSTFGYKPEEVDEYLRDVATAYAKVVKEKEEDELKIVKLVEKINEYRGDEDAIRDALLVAQKEGNRIVAEAKAQAEQIMLEANSKRDAAMAEIENDCENLKRQQIEKVAAAIKAESDKLSAVEAAAKTRLDMQADKLNAMKKEVTEFKRKLMVMLDQQIKSAVALPELTDEQIENILNTQPTDVPAQPEAPQQPEKRAEEKQEKHEDKTPTAFGFSEFKRQNYSADELKFGQRRN